MLVGLWPPSPGTAIPSGGRPPGPPRARFRACTDPLWAFTGTAVELSPQLMGAWWPLATVAGDRDSFRGATPRAPTSPVPRPRGRFPALTGAAGYNSSPGRHSRPRRCGQTISRLSFAHGEAAPDPGHGQPRRMLGGSPVTHPGFLRPLLGPRALYYGRCGLAPVPAGRAGHGFCRIQIPGTLRAGAQVRPDPGRVDGAPWIHRVSCPGSGAGSGLGSGRTGSSPEARDHA
jgi:hypothetical protein